MRTPKDPFVVLNINMDQIPEHPDGLERMQALKENYDEGSTMEGMYQLMQRAKYSNMFDPAKKWYSELGFTYAEIREITEDGDEEMDKVMKRLQEAFENELEYVKEHGFREETNFWTTSHTSVYDINNRKMWITVRERYEEGPHEFTF